MDVLEMSLKAAAVGLGETKTIADLSTSAMNAYGSGTLSASGATDILTAAVREGKLEASALAGAMGGVIPLASNMGVSFDQVGAALAAMSKTGTDAATGATQLTAILASLKKPSAEAEQAFSAMGMTTESVQKSISEKGLLSTLEMLQNGLKQTGKDTTAIFPNIRALKGVLDLTGAGLEDNRRIFDALSKSMGATDTAFKKTAKSASYQMTQGLNSMKESLMGVGEVILKAIAPAIKELGEFITDLSNKFKELSPQTQKIIIAFAGIVAALGPLLVVLGALMTTVIPGLTIAFTALTAAMVANPFGLIAVAIASVIGYFVFFNDETEKAIKNQDLFSKINDKAAKSISNEKAKLNELLAIAKHEGVSKKHRIDAIRELNKLSPKYLGDLTLEKINTDSARVAVELYNKELLKTARIKAAQEKLQEITAQKITIELAETKKIVEQAKKLKTLKENAITQADFLKIKSQEQIGYGRTQTGLYTSQLDLLKQQEKAILDLITAEATRTTTTSLGGDGGGVPTRPMATSALDGISTAEIQTPISDSIDADTARMPQAFAEQQAVLAQNRLTALDKAAQFAQQIGFR
jgi:TP901 family phage tail tape measure protein